MIRIATQEALTVNLIQIKMPKCTTKKNEEKLRIFLSKANDATKTDNSNKKPAAVAPADKVIQKGVRK